MKRILIILVILCFCFCLFACNADSNHTSSEKTSNKPSIDIEYSGEDEPESLEDEPESLSIADDDYSRYVVSNVVLDSSEAEETKFDVYMTVNTVTTWEDEFGGGGGDLNRTTKVPLNCDCIVLKIINNNEEFLIACSGFWRLEKFVDGEYIEIAVDDREATNIFGRVDERSGFLYVWLEELSDLISEGKYRFISPTLNITKETEDGLQEHTYQNEKSFILYSEFDFVQ